MPIFTAGISQFVDVDSAQARRHRTGKPEHLAAQIDQFRPRIAVFAFYRFAQRESHGEPSCRSRNGARGQYRSLFKINAALGS